MEPSSTSPHLQRFLSVLQRLKKEIPDFHWFVKPLHDFMESVFMTAVNRAMQGVCRGQLNEHDWGTGERTAFTHCKDAFAHEITLANHDLSARLCTCTQESYIA